MSWIIGRYERYSFGFVYLFRLKGMYAGNVCSALYLFSNKVGFVTSFQKVCR